MAHTNGQVDEGQVKVIETSLVLRATGPNKPNQSAIGTAPGALSDLVQLCRDPSSSVDVQRYASDALAVLASSEEIRERFEQHAQQAFAVLTNLCGMERAPEVQRNAAAALGNLAYCHVGNQTAIGDVEGIGLL